MCDKKITLPELIMAAVCYLQEKNGVSCTEIVQFVATKRGCKPEQIQEMIKSILCKAKNNEILCEHKGLYRINERYDDLPQFGEKKKDTFAPNVDIGSDSDCDSDGPDPCACLKLSKECLEDSEEERCPIKQKPKCR